MCPSSFSIMLSSGSSRWGNVDTIRPLMRCDVVNAVGDGCRGCVAFHVCEGSLADCGFGFIQDRVEFYLCQ